MDYPFFRFPWTCLSPRSCVKAEGDLDGLYAAMGLGYFARCAMERAQWGAGQLSRTYEQQGTMATMVDGGWNVSIVSTNQFVWGLDKCLWNGCLVPKKAVHEECELAHWCLQVFDVSFPCGDVSLDREASEIRGLKLHQSAAWSIWWNFSEHLSRCFVFVFHECVSVYPIKNGFLGPPFFPWWNAGLWGPPILWSAWFLVHRRQKTRNLQGRLSVLEIPSDTSFCMEPSTFQIVWVNGDMRWFPKCQTNIATFVGYEVSIVKSNIGYGVLIFVPTYLLVYVAILFLGSDRCPGTHVKLVQRATEETTQERLGISTRG